MYKCYILETYCLKLLPSWASWQNIVVFPVPKKNNNKQANQYMSLLYKSILNSISRNCTHSAIKYHMCIAPAEQLGCISRIEQDAVLKNHSKTVICNNLERFLFNIKSHIHLKSNQSSLTWKPHLEVSSTRHKGSSVWLVQSQMQTLCASKEFFIFQTLYTEHKFHH